MAGVDDAFYRALGINPAWPEQWQRKLKSLPAVECSACIRLLIVQQFRSAFRESMRMQLEGWLDDPNPAFDSPFSIKQWAYLLNVHDIHAVQRAKERSHHAQANKQSMQ